MARGKKKETLTPEERLQAALVPESEQPYKIPGNWCWTQLGTYIDFATDYVANGSFASLKQNVAYYKEENYAILVKTQDFSNSFTEDLTYTDKRGYDFLKKSVLYGGELILSNIGSIGKVFRVPHLNKPMTLAPNSIMIKCYRETDYDLLYYYFLSPFGTEQLYSITTGTAVKKFNKTDLKAICLPLPPLFEQQRIVDRIESLFSKLDEAKQKAQEALDSFEIRKAAILHKAFTGELTAQWRKEHGVGLESWEKLKIGTYAQVKGGKRLPKGHKLVTDRTAHPYLRIADFGDGTINDSDLHYVTEDTFSQIKNYIINKGDVYISIVGSIGKAGIIPESLDGANLTENAARIISVRTLPQYLCAFLSSPEAQSDIQGRIRSATLGKLSLLNIKDIETPVPSINEQTEIVHILDDLLAKEQQAKESAEGVLEQIDLIKKAILARAFRGELGTNDPTEESAVKLLCSWD